MTERPLERLCGLAQGRLSGEFICVAPALEVHVYLREGRIAWGADAKSSVDLTSHLQKAANIDPETLRSVVAECRRDRRSLGETLVSWGLATRQQLRESLRNQIAPALSRLSKTASAQTLFLERNYDPYDHELTFALDDLLENSVIARAREGALSTSLRPLLASEFARQLLDTIEGAVWVEIVEGAKVLDRASSLDGELDGAPSPNNELDEAPSLELLRTRPAFLSEPLHDGANFVAVRSPTGAVIGVPLSLGSRSVWCRLDADSTFGAALSVLWSFAGRGAYARATGPRARHDVDWEFGAEDPTALETLRAFQSRAPDVAACIVLRGERAPLGCGSNRLVAEEALGLARRRAANLALFRSHDKSANGRSMVTGEAELYCFGAELPSSPDAEDTVWIFLSRTSSQGIGWAYLTALTRALAELERKATP